MHNELEDNNQDYRFILHEHWCDLLYVIEVEENRERDATHIKRLATSKEASNYDSDESVRVPR